VHHHSSWDVNLDAAFVQDFAWNCEFLVAPENASQGCIPKGCKRIRGASDCDIRVHAVYSRTAFSAFLADRASRFSQRFESPRESRSCLALNKSVAHELWGSVSEPSKTLVRRS